MNNSKGNVLSERVNKTNYQIRQDKTRRSSRYDYTDMKDEVLRMHKDFAILIYTSISAAAFASFSFALLYPAAE